MLSTKGNAEVFCLPTVLNGIGFRLTVDPKAADIQGQKGRLRNEPNDALIASFMEAARRGGGSFFDSRQRAEIVSLDTEDRVELAAKVFQRDHRGQFY